MADKYIPQDIEPKWQKKWMNKLYRSVIDHSKKKFCADDLYPRAICTSATGTP
jgi:leucyl-tRNA synthetase